MKAMDNLTALPDSNLSRSKKLLKDAVYARKKKVTLHDRLFALWFERLVYPQIWEDPVVDLKALVLKPTDHLITIASGGCNALSYLTASPKKITAVDLNHTHVALVHLKMEGIRRLEYKNFYRFFGEAKSVNNPRLYRDLLAPHLNKATRDYWEGGIKGFERIRMFEKGFYKYGLLGKLIGLIHISAKLYRVKLDDLLRQPSIEAQGKWFDENVAKIFDSRLAKKIMGSPVALYNLGIPPSQHASLCEDRPESMAQVLKERARKLATIDNINNNYFACQAYGRSYDHNNPTNKPLYLQEQYFELIRNNIDRLSIEQNNVLDALKRMPANSVDAVVLLDAQDWMTAEEICTLWTEITRTANPGARIIFRTAGKSSPIETALSEDLNALWKRNHATSDQLIHEDRSAIYGGFHLYELTT
jgi:S-adenosylmethionine-diacylglycerol 3-amino-3-carboxypropyl transferase